VGIVQVTAEHLLQRLLEQANDHVVILLDANGLIVGWIAAAEKTFGYTAAEVLDQNVSILFPPEDNARGVVEHELNVARTSGRAQDDRWLVRKGGARFWASGVAVALRDDEREIIGFGKVLRDRTDLRTQIEALENRVQSLSETATRKNAFIALLAHEIKNPLNTFKIGMQTIARDATGTIAQVVPGIERQVNFMVRLVEDLQEVSRASACKVTLRWERVALQDVLNRAAESARPHTEQRKQSFHIVLVPAPLMVDIDPDRIFQAVTNLLENAIKYTPGGGTIWLKCTVEEHEAIIRVEDTGVGIHDAALPYIFDLFTQEKSSESMARGGLGAGLGLGLPLVKELVTLHGGTVQVRSEGKNKGAEFTIRLPLSHH
jgi:PAS domain S-box-containing protein